MLLSLLVNGAVWQPGFCHLEMSAIRCTCKVCENIIRVQKVPSVKFFKLIYKRTNFVSVLYCHRLSKLILFYCQSNTYEWHYELLCCTFFGKTTCNYAINVRKHLNMCFHCKHMLRCKWWNYHVVQTLFLPCSKNFCANNCVCSAEMM